MNILICEDEKLASKHLAQLVRSVYEDSNIVDIVETGHEALLAIEKYDLNLIFMDVELADGSCFETLDSKKVDTPIIFTTAYDEYALEAFKMNAIDYLLKPISQQDVEKAFAKWKSISQNIDHGSGGFTFSKEVFRKSKFKNRFLVKLGKKLFPIDISEISYFAAKEKFVFLVTNKGKKYIVNYSLSELEELLNPSVFYRLNRKYISNIESILELEPYFKGQVTVSLNPSTDEDVIVSRNKTPELKNWLGV